MWDVGLSDAELTEELDESNFIDGYHLDVDKCSFMRFWETARKKCSAAKTVKDCAVCAAGI